MDKMYKKMYDNAIAVANATAGLESYIMSWWRHDTNLLPIFPLVAEETIRAQGRPAFPMTHDWLMLGIVFAGTQTYDFETYASLTLQPNDLIMIPPHCNYRCGSSQGYHKLILMIDGALLQEHCSVLGLDHPAIISHPEAAVLHDLLQQTVCLLRDDAANISETVSMTYKLMTEASVANSARSASADFRLYNNIKLTLGDNLDRKISLGNIAAKFNISNSLLHKLFQRYSSISPKQYRINRKMEQASYYLTYTELSIKEISDRLGYLNQHYFSNDFKKHFRSSPSNYRDQTSEK